MTLETKSGGNWTVYIGKEYWDMVATDEKGSGLSGPSDFELRAKKHPAPEFAKEAESRREAKQDDDNSFAVVGPWNWRIESKGPWLKQWGGLVAFAMAITAVAVAVMLWKGLR